jgi:AcrR family transcriptional regulator
VAATDARTLRRDARRNRERLLESACELFARTGIEVSVEEIARCAGLGVGTVYRHFATKEELIDAVLENSYAELVSVAEAAAAEKDAWAGFTSFLEQTLTLYAANRALKDVIGRAHLSARAEAMRDRMQPLLRRLVKRAHEQGELRQDFTPADLAILLWAVFGVVERTEAVAPGHWRRFLGLVLDGLRTRAASPLHGPSLSWRQLVLGRGTAAGDVIGAPGRELDLGRPRDRQAGPHGAGAAALQDSRDG